MKKVELSKNQNGCWELPECAQLQGIGPSLIDGDLPSSTVSIQYTNHSNEWMELQMPLGDFLYLHNMSRQFVRDEKLHHRLSDPKNN